MAIITYHGHTSRAQDWYEKEDVYFAIGGQAKWPDDDKEIPPETEDETMDDLICYRRVEQKFYVIEDPDGELYYHGSNWRIVDEGSIYTERVRHIYITSYLNYDEAPVNVQYRKIGVYTHVIPAPDVPEGKYTLLPSDVTDPGRLEVVAHDAVTMRSANKREKLAIILEF